MFKLLVPAFEELERTHAHSVLPAKRRELCGPGQAREDVDDGLPGAL